MQLAIALSPPVSRDFKMTEKSLVPNGQSLHLRVRALPFFYKGLTSPRGLSWARQYTFWGVLVLCAGIPRIVAAFLVPNEEWDPYSYVYAIESMRASIAAGTFSLSELFGFWLPIYQVICAVISLFVGHSLYVAKVVSAVCGAGVCLAVFLITRRLTANREISLIVFSIIAFNPLHVRYSAFSMTDVPHAFVVITSLYFVLNKRWILAASCIAVGCLMRTESWPIVLLLPALQFLLQHRISLTALCISLFAPLFWLYICWAATGNPLEYFKVRNSYISKVLAGDAGASYFSAARIAGNVRALLYSTGPAVIIACLIGAWLLTRRLRREQFSESSWAPVAALAYFFSSLGFLVLAYLTRNQPDILNRYGLILFALGLPVFGWTSVAIKTWKSGWTRALFGLFVTLCLCQWGIQARHGAQFLEEVSQKGIVAHYLRDKHQSSPGSRIFCDDATVQVLSGIPAPSFLDSSNSPADPEPFLSFLKENRVEYLVYERREPSAAVDLFRALSDKEINSLFQLMISPNPGAGDLELRVYLFNGGLPKL